MANNKAEKLSDTSSLKKLRDGVQTLKGEVERMNVELGVKETILQGKELEESRGMILDDEESQEDDGCKYL